MSPREEVRGLADRVSLRELDLESALHQAYLLGLQEAQGQDQVFRVVDHTGEPVGRRAWTSRGPATLALRHSYVQGTVQVGKVTWTKETKS